MPRDTMKVIRLLEPELCIQCRFAQVAEVQTAGMTQRMIHCRRLDCDNWDVAKSEPALSVEPVDFDGLDEAA